jgi:hypothetical protein
VGNRHLAPQGASVVLINRSTGRRVEPGLTEAGSGKRIDCHEHILGAGPKANEHIKRRTAFGAARRSAKSTLRSADHVRGGRSGQRDDHRTTVAHAQ